ncbi:MAG: hypothetical protein WDW38_000106 [Sanguina aurantia]
MGCAFSFQEPSAPSAVRVVDSHASAAAQGLPPRVKLVLLGDSGVGKSCLVLRYVKGQFDASMRITVGAAFVSHRVLLPDGNSIKFEIWDTAGQERYRSLAPLYYRGAHAAAIVYDITSRETFVKAQFWIQELQRHAGPDIVIVLVGNKMDLEELREVSELEAQSFADSLSLIYMEASAKTAMHVASIFESVASELAGGLPISSNASAA